MHPRGAGLHAGVWRCLLLQQHGCRGDRLDGRDDSPGRHHGHYRHCVDALWTILSMPPRPDISVLIPVRNEDDRIGKTIRSIARARSTDARIEFVVVNDDSDDDCVDQLLSTMPDLLDEPRIDIRLESLGDRAGVYGARNRAAAHAAADILFMTDAHVRFSSGWDQLVLENVRHDRVLAATILHGATGARGYGCRLVVPFMGTHWNTTPVEGLAPVQIAPCSGTALPKALFDRLGGYDDGMLLYGAGEPEFSVRAWLHGAEIQIVGPLEVEHRFKPQDEILDFIETVRNFWVHNCIRFGLLYLSELSSLQLISYYVRTFPAITPNALAMIDQSDVWERRALLESHRERSFDWFVERFGVTDELGRGIL
jgi:glycosyltransferase involved in cell wall biosynthesis